MKKLLLSLVFVSSLVNAQALVMRNNGGGEIILTAQACQADNGQYTALKHAYTWTNKMYFEGCWLLQDGNIHIVWIKPDGTRERRVYSVNDFDYRK